MYQLQKWGHVSVAEMGGMCSRNGRYVSVAEMVCVAGMGVCISCRNGAYVLQNWGVNIKVGGVLMNYS